jgi:hypothetical protein
VIDAIAWGSLPEWIAAIGTVGALAVALVLLKAELDDARLRRGEEVRAQARRVLAWIEYTGDHPEVVIRNASDAPIYNVEATATETAGQHFEHGRTSVSRSKVLPPGDTERSEVYEPGQWAWVNVWFTDSAENHWIRSGDGRLTKVDEPAPFHGCDG